MRRRHMLLALLTLLARPARAQTAEIDIDNFVFTPPSLTVARGTKVVWVNHDDIPHLVVASSSPPAFRSKALDTDDRFENVFDTTGRFPYFCALHPHMQGVVIVYG
jgi:plastocyanin